MLRLHVKQKFPQPRHIQRAASLLRGGGLAIYPTDTTYGLGCDLYNKRSIDRLYQLKGMDPKKPLSFLCSELSQVARYALVDDRSFRILRQRLPGKYTFLLRASREVPKIVQSKRHTVGIRIPNSPVCLALLEELGHPLITTTVGRRGDDDDTYMNDPDDIALVLGRSIEVFLDGGFVDSEPSTVIDLTSGVPELVRKGAGDVAWMR